MKDLIASNDTESPARLAADQGVGQNPRGVIVAANESRFASTFYSEPLTAYTVGWKDPENLETLLETLAPAVPVARRFEYKLADNAQAFLSESDDVRAIGSSFKKVEYAGTSANEKTLNKGLTMCVDHDDEVGDGWREMYVGRLMQRLLRNEVRRATALLLAAATSASKTWNSSANPDGDVRAMRIAGADSTGITGNTIVFGEAAWELRLDAYEAAANTSSYAGRAAAMTKEQLAAKLGADRVEVVKARYQSTATAKANVLGSYVLGYFAVPGVGKDDPSHVKRFVTPTAGGKFRVYVMEHEKTTDITVEHYSNIVITTSTGVRRLAIS